MARSPATLACIAAVTMLERVKRNKYMRRLGVIVPIASLAIVATLAATFGLLRHHDSGAPSPAELGKEQSDALSTEAGVARATDLRSLIGTKYPPLPPEFTESGFSTVGEADTATYAVVLVAAPDKGLLLGKRRNPVGQSSGEPWLVADALPLPLLREGFVAYMICGSLKRPLAQSDTAYDALDYSVVEIDRTVIAVSHRTTNVLQTDLAQVWRVNTIASRFEAAERTGLVCVNDSG